MSSKIYLVAALVLAAASCFANTITVTNFSFETLPDGGLTFAGCGAGCSYSEGSGIPGWSISPGAQIGQFQPGNPGNTNYFSALSDGITSAYSNIDGSVISQTVGETVVIGEVYTLLIDIGWRFDAPFTGTADLLINGHTYNATGTTPTRGTFGLFTASYTGTAADVGQFITIELRSSGPQANFDNVRLDGSVPEPASFLLIAPALLALGWRIKRTARP
jgi:hypothetical protein